jgi:hypothetical protein
LVHRIEATRLHDAVRHRRLILPQLGASGVAAHEVKKRSGFKVAYGPVRAADLPVFLESGQATPEMRRARFGLRERAILVPVELVHIVLPLTILAAIITLLTSAALSDLGIAVAIGAGVVLFPILLPWLPTRDFSSKGFILGGLIALPFVLDTLLNNPELAWWRQGGAVLALILTMLPATAYVALSFTGSSTFTSRSGVRREIFTYIPIMAAMFVAGLVLSILLSLI